MTQETKLNYVRIAAILITLGLLFVGFYYNKQHPLPAAPIQQSIIAAPGIINDVIFDCANQMAIHAQFLDDRTVNLELSDSRTMTLPQTVSADGARYATADESFVFWNKANTAFVQENGTETYSSCTIFNGQ